MSPQQLAMMVLEPLRNVCKGDRSYFIDILALQLLEKFGETLFVGVNPNRGQDILDVAFRRVGVASEAEEEICCEMLHCELVVFSAVSQP